MIRRIGQVPVNRRNPFKAMKSLEQAADLIRTKPDFCFLILPEGTRTRDGKLGVFKKGGFHLALEAGLDILPLIQTGAFGINRRGSKLIRPGTVDFIIEKPVPAQVAGRQDLDGLMQRVRDVFLQYVE